MHKGRVYMRVFVCICVCMRMWKRVFSFCVFLTWKIVLSPLKNMYPFFFFIYKWLLFISSVLFSFFKPATATAFVYFHFCSYSFFPFFLTWKAFFLPSPLFLSGRLCILFLFIFLIIFPLFFRPATATAHRMQSMRWVTCRWTEAVGILKFARPALIIKYVCFNKHTRTQAHTHAHKHGASERRPLVFWSAHAQLL